MALTDVLQQIVNELRPHFVHLSNGAQVRYPTDFDDPLTPPLSLSCALFLVPFSKCWHEIKPIIM